MRVGGRVGGESDGVRAFKKKAKHVSLEVDVQDHTHTL